MVASDALFTYAGAALANQAETSQSKRLEHRNVTLSAMGISVGSSLFMLLGRD
jgi:L-asparagine transporter-like permease